MFFASVFRFTNLFFFGIIFMQAIFIAFARLNIKATIEDTP